MTENKTFSQITYGVFLQYQLLSGHRSPQTSMFLRVLYHHQYNHCSYHFHQDLVLALKGLLWNAKHILWHIYSQLASNTPLQCSSLWRRHEFGCKRSRLNSFRIVPTSVHDSIRYGNPSTINLIKGQGHGPRSYCVSAMFAAS